MEMQDSKGYKEAETRNQLMKRESKGSLGLKKKLKLSEIKQRYKVKRKRLETVIEELK